ncbi:MAG: type II toxin-antitoxin system HicB family antitoxin [Myxococcaceae bacterium]
MRLTIEFDREEDGRWIAEVTELPGVMAYGETREMAKSHVQALALRVVADRLDRTKEPQRGRSSKEVFQLGSLEFAFGT